jgi:hypothetical protein
MFVPWLSMLWGWHNIVVVGDHGERELLRTIICCFIWNLLCQIKKSTGSMRTNVAHRQTPQRRFHWITNKSIAWSWSWLIWWHVLMSKCTTYIQYHIVNLSSCLLLVVVLHNHTISLKYGPSFPPPSCSDTMEKKQKEQLLSPLV